MKSLQNSLFWRLSLFFLLGLMVLAGGYIYITYSTSLEYSQETSQKLNRSVAKRIAKHTKPFLNGSLDTLEVKNIFHNVMVLNPSVEVYLLNNEGEILSFYAPFGKVKLTHLDLGPIHEFEENPDAVIKGEDPRNPGVYKIFSASKILDSENQVGYIYVILASEEYTTVTSMLENSFRMKLATKSILVTLISTIVIGMILIWYLTKNLNKIIKSVNDFKNGDLNARINLKTKGELSVLANNIDEMSDTLVEYINERKSLENLKKELIANVSHDLRTPLTSIQGYAETLVMLDEKLSKEDKMKYTNFILSSTEKVKKLVDDLFEISKLESNSVRTQFETFSIEEMVSDIVSKYELIAKSNDLELEFESNVKKPYVYADIALINRVMQNLIDNAIKHTPSGGKVKVIIQMINDQLMVSVKDTGVGIPDGELPYIFDRYRKGNSESGTGLGLAIVKKILELHNSEIDVVSVLQQGTSFTFNLPVK